LITAEARPVHAKGLPCLDEAQLIRFGIAGDGQLIDNQTTWTGSRQLQHYQCTFGRIAYRFAEIGLNSY
jgi:beta-galactosidase